MMSQEPKEILQKIRRIELRTKRLVDSSFAGAYHSVFKGSGMNFEEVREYSPGDEIRTIDWNVTARMNVPYVKKFVEEREMTVMLMLDISASGCYGSVHSSKRELAAEVASLLAFSAIQNNDKVGLILFAEEVELFIPPKKGRQHILRLIREMLYFEPESRGTNLHGALEYLNQVLLRRAVVFLISDFLAEDFVKPLRVTSKRHDVVAFPVVDPGEERLPAVGRLTLQDAETGVQVELNTHQRSIPLLFEVLSQRRAQELNQLFRQQHIDVVWLRTDQDYLVPLRNFFATRERRRRR